MFDLYERNRAVFTSPRFLPPALLDGVKLTDAIVSPGSTVVESTLDNAVVGIRSRVEKGCTIRVGPAGLPAPSWGHLCLRFGPACTCRRCGRSPGLLAPRHVPLDHHFWLSGSRCASMAPSVPCPIQSVLVIGAGCHQNGNRL